MSESKKILIGSNEYIDFMIIKDLPSFNIDLLLHDTESFWKVIELNCQSECCGLQAYCFLPPILIKYRTEFYDRTIFQKFSTLYTAISKLPEEYLTSEILCDSFSKQDFLKLLKHILAHLVADICIDEKKLILQKQDPSAFNTTQIRH